MVYYTQTELKEKLLELNKDIRIYNYHDRDVNGVFYRGICVGAIPKGRVYEWPLTKYRDDIGGIHRGLRHLFARLKDERAVKASDINKFLNK